MSTQNGNRDDQKLGSPDDIKWRRQLFLGSVFMLATGSIGGFHFLTNLDSIEQAIPQQAVENHPLRDEFKAQCIQERNDWESWAQLTNSNIASFVMGTPRSIESCTDQETRHDIATTQDPDLDAGVRFWAYVLTLGAFSMTYGYIRSRFPGPGSQ